MSRISFKRLTHQQVVAILSRLDHTFLTQTQCYFGGGTRIVLELGEYRESRDIDFICSNQEGYRRLRETVSETSLGEIVSSDLSLVREVRADLYGIRTFLEDNGAKLKFEIIREARIGTEGESVPGIPVTCLSRRYCFAEKFLANADRGLDASTLSRDIIDLAFMIEGWSKEDADAGITTAKFAYGDVIQCTLGRVARKLREDKAYRNRCVEGLAITDTKTMAAGIKALARFNGEKVA